MSTTRRVGAVLVCVVLMSTVGCDKSGTTGAQESYSKKLVGTWEGTEEAKDGGKDMTVTMEFKADGSMKLSMGPFELTGTYKVTKEDGKTVTVDTEMTIEGLGDEKNKPKASKKTLSVVFEDANTIVVSAAEGNPDPKKLKRKG